MNAIIQQFADKGQGSIHLDLSFKPGIALLTIDNSSRHNALSGKMMVEFYNAIKHIERNTHDLVALVAMGAGSTSFCAGLDLRFASDFIKTPQDILALNQLMHESIDRLARLPLVTVAVVTGGAIGGGSELLVGFDFVCMSKQTGFVHFVQTRMGVSSPWGGMRRLLQIVGRKKALQWMAGGYRLEANACFEAGLVDILAETDQTSLAQTLLFLKPFLINSNRKVSYEAVRGMKKLVTRQDKTNDWHYENDVFSSTVFSKL